MTTLQATDQQFAAVAELGKQSEVILRYFTLFNLGKYQQVADLFTANGRLYPPFESPVVGQERISDYLSKEADGMTVSLLSAEVEPQGDARFQVSVRGSVTALVFKVNVSWCFLLTDDNRIESVRVDLIATLEELLSLRPA